MRRRRGGCLSKVSFTWPEKGDYVTAFEGRSQFGRWTVRDMVK